MVIYLKVTKLITPNFKKNCYFTCENQVILHLNVRKLLKMTKKKGYFFKANLVKGDEIITGVISSV